MKRILSICLILLAPVMVFVACGGERPALVLALMGFCFLTDLVDGVLARWLRSTSTFSARLDSIADFTFYLGIPAAGWLVWPAIVAREAPWFIAGVASVVLPATVGFAKFRLASGYHVWLAKLAACCMGVGVLLLFGFGIAAPFRVAVAVAIIAALEEIAITLVLEQPRADVRGLWQVLAERRASGYRPPSNRAH